MDLSTFSKGSHIIFISDVKIEECLPLIADILSLSTEPQKKDIGEIQKHIIDVNDEMSLLKKSYVVLFGDLFKEEKK